jgi:hypothetical protein
VTKISLKILTFRRAFWQDPPELVRLGYGCHIPGAGQ